MFFSVLCCVWYAVVSRNPAPLLVLKVYDSGAASSPQVTRGYLTSTRQTSIPPKPVGELFDLRGGTAVGSPLAAAVTGGYKCVESFGIKRSVVLWG